MLLFLSAIVNSIVESTLLTLQASFSMVYYLYRIHPTAFLLLGCFAFIGIIIQYIKTDKEYKEELARIRRERRLAKIAQNIIHN